MDPRTSLRRRVGDTPLLRAPALAAAAGLPNLRLKMEGANPTGTQKDRIARLEVQNAVGRKADGITVASCGNFGVAVAHAAYVHELACVVFVPESFQGERLDLMRNLNAEVHPVPGTYEDAVLASREYAKTGSYFDANPGRANTLGTLVGYSTIAKEICEKLGEAPVAVGAPIGNGSTLAGVHLGFRTAWTQGRIKSIPMMIGGTSRDNNPLPAAVARGQDQMTPMDPRSIVETHVNEPLVNWDALDGTACLVAIQDSAGTAYGHTDEELMALHRALAEDGIEAHPASLSAVAALQQGAADGMFPADALVVAVLTSGRPQISVSVVEQPETEEATEEVLNELNGWLGRFGDPISETRQAVKSAFTGGFVLEARDPSRRLGLTVLTPMDLSEFFPKYHLSYIAVSPEARGLGVGSILLEEAIRLTEGDLSLHVETDNDPAIRLYEKFGFTKKYYRMLYKGSRTMSVDPAMGSGWEGDSEATALTAGRTKDA